MKSTFPIKSYYNYIHRYNCINIECMYTPRYTLVTFFNIVGTFLVVLYIYIYTKAAWKISFTEQEWVVPSIQIYESSFKKAIEELQIYILWNIPGKGIIYIVSQSFLVLKGHTYSN